MAKDDNARQPMRQHQYEIKRNYNAVTRFLHNYRYRTLFSVVDDLTKRNRRQIKIVEIGCGVAAAFGLLRERFDFSYTGIELQNEYAELAYERYGTQPNFTIINDSIVNAYEYMQGADLVIAMDSLEHIPEHIVVRVIEEIAAKRPEVFYCTVPNEIGPAIAIKNVGSALMGYHRHRSYTWSETFYASFYNLDRVRLHGTGHQGFDWRWLRQTIRHNMVIQKQVASPAQWVPKFVSPTIGFVCVPRAG